MDDKIIYHKYCTIFYHQFSSEKIFYFTYQIIMISNPSTFGQTAFFTGKNNKLLIYNKRWIDYSSKNSKKHDSFWVDLHNGGNKYYNAWKFI